MKPKWFIKIIFLKGEVNMTDREKVNEEFEEDLKKENKKGLIVLGSLVALAIGLTGFRLGANYTAKRLERGLNYVFLENPKLKEAFVDSMLAIEKKKILKI